VANSGNIGPNELVHTVLKKIKIDECINKREWQIVEVLGKQNVRPFK